MNRCLYIFIFFCLVGSCFGETLNMEHLTAADGLFSNRIYKTLKSSSGCMWFIGINGVCRFDGVHIVNFTSKNKGKCYIAGDRFYDIAEDATGQIWIGGNAGLFKYNESTTSFEQVKENRIKNVYSISIINDSLMWLSLSNYGNNVAYNYSQDNISDLSFNGAIRTHIETFNKDFLTAFRTGVILSEKVDTIFKNKVPINDICQTPNGDIWIAVAGGLHRVRLDVSGRYLKSNRVRVTLSYNNVTSLAYAQGYLWVATRKGLNRILLDERGKVISSTVFLNLPDNPNSLLNNDITDLYVDNEDILWIASYGGVNKIDASRQWFLNYRNDPKTTSSLHTNNIFSIDGDTLGHVWFGSVSEGLSMLDLSNSSFTSFNHLNSRPLRLVKSIYTDLNDNVWVAADHSLFLATPSGLKNIDIIDVQGGSYKYKKITDIIQHPDGRFFVSVDGCVLVMLKVTARNYKVIHVYKKRKVAAIKFYIDTFQRVWLATRNMGVLLLHEPCIGDIFYFNKSNQNCFKTNEIQAIHQDSDGNLWLGSINGLYCVENDSIFRDEPESIQFKSFFVEDGLVDNYISNILPADNGDLWLSSWSGLMKYDASCFGFSRFVPYTFSEGLVDDKYNRTAAYKDEKRNTYYFGSVNGVNYFTPVEETRNIDSSEVIIHRLNINGEDVLLEYDKSRASFIPLIYYGEISNLELEFSSSSHRSISNQVFGYKIEGKVDSLIYTRNRVLNCEELKSGKYVLKIGAVSQDGRIGEMLEIPIIVKSRMFLYVLFVTIFSFFIGLYMRKKKRNIETNHIETATKYAYSKLDKNKSDIAKDRLLNIMCIEKPYLDPHLSAENLAQRIDITQAELSQLLTESLNSHFYEYINKYRIEEFISLLKTEDVKRLTIYALAQKCGFSSKSTFYRAFKQEKGMTPVKFIKFIDD